MRENSSWQAWVVAITTFIIILLVFAFLLTQVGGVFEKCEGQADNFTFLYQDHQYNCGELRAITNLTSEVAR